MARSRWLRRHETLEGEASVDALERWLRGLDERSWTLLRLELDGGLSLAARARLDALLERQAGELLHLRLDDRRLALEPSAEDLAQLQVEGFVGRTAEVLRSRVAAGDTDDATAATGALRLLHRFLTEEGA